MGAETMLRDHLGKRITSSDTMEDMVALLLRENRGLLHNRCCGEACDYRKAFVGIQEQYTKVRRRLTSNSRQALKRRAEGAEAHGAE